MALLTVVSRIRLGQLRAVLVRSSLVISLGALAACGSIGPATIRTDQVDYADSIGTAETKQLLLNLVRVRYHEVPSFISVSQLVASYGLELRSEATLTAMDRTNSGGGARGATKQTSSETGTRFLAYGDYTDKPTITYTPVRGGDAARLLLNPVPPEVVFGLLASDQPARLVLGLPVAAINGVRNITGAREELATEGAQFREIVDLLDQLSNEERVALRFVDDHGVKQAHLVFADKNPAGPRELRLRELLGLDLTTHDFPIVFGLGRGEPNEITIHTRSMIEVLRTLSQVVPVRAGFRAHESKKLSSVDPFLDKFQIQMGRRPPLDAFTAIEHGGRWYWIDRDDADTIETISFVMLLLNVEDSTSKTQVPIITIPAG
jgi:hypothetical protein